MAAFSKSYSHVEEKRTSYEVHHIKILLLFIGIHKYDEWKERMSFFSSSGAS